jgi:hypothetical protein
MCSDLAENLPGDSTRRKADELKAASPGKAFLARLLNVKTDERAYRKGSKGEEEVARRLRRLGPDWHVLHAIQVSEKGTDIDHLVMGPPGVFSLNTKNHLNANVWVAERVIMVNGKKVPYLRNSRSEGAKASKTLTSSCGYHVDVRPVIVVMAKSLKFAGRPLDVDVVPRKKIAPWLESQPIRLTPERVSEIYAAARRSST